MTKNVLEFGDLILIRFRPKRILNVFKTYSDHIKEILQVMNVSKEQADTLKKLNSISGYFAGITECDKFIGIEFLGEGMEKGVIRFYPTKDIQSFTRFPRNSYVQPEKIKTVMYDTTEKPDVIEGYIG